MQLVEINWNPTERQLRQFSSMCFIGLPFIGWLWGAGPILLFDTASDDTLGAGRWGVGPSAVALRQDGAWTYGGLVNYIADVGGDSDRDDIEVLFYQPFLTYTFGNGKTSATVQSEITRDLENYETAAFAIATVNQIFKVGNQLLQGRIGVRHWYESPDFGPDGTELSLRLTFMFPQ